LASSPLGLAERNRNPAAPDAAAFEIMDGALAASSAALLAEETPAPVAGDPEAARTRPDAGAARTMLLRAAFARKRGQVLAAVAALLVLALALWISRRSPALTPGSTTKRAASPASRGPLGAPVPAQAGRLRIDFDHPLKSGTLRVYVDDELQIEEALTGQKRKKALVFGMHEGSFREELDVPPGRHEVRVEVRWDDNMRTERIVGTFRSGATRRLEAGLGRIRRDLSLEWK